MALRRVPVAGLYGRTYRQWRRFLRQSSGWGRREIAAYQAASLRRIVRYAYERVPYYQRIFDKQGLHPNDLRGGEDLQRIPLLSKEAIAKHCADLVSRAYPRIRMERVNTGGTSGRRMTFLRPRENAAMEWAFMTALWERVGYREGDRRIYIGDILPSSSNGTHWVVDVLKRECRFSPFHLSPRELPVFLDQIGRLGYPFLHGYPSALSFVARHALDRGIAGLPKVKAVLLGSEPVYPWQREALEEAFGARVFSWYGQSEQVVLAGECEAGSRYHLVPEYGFAEIVHPDGTPAKAGEQGEIVGTGFYNWAMPLIRYRMDDWGRIEEGDCACGRPHAFLTDIEAKRDVNVIHSRHGHPISTTSVHLRNGILNNVERFQFLQERAGELVLQVVRGNGYTDGDTRRILASLDKQMGDSLDISIRFVDRLPLSASGKQQILDQRIPGGAASFYSRGWDS